MWALYCQLSPHLQRVAAVDSDIYLTFPQATSQNTESPIIFILDPDSPLAQKYNHVYPNSTTPIPLITFYRSDFLVSFEGMKSMLPHNVVYDESIGSRADWEFNMDINAISHWLADESNNIKTIIINTGPHYNSVQFGGGIDLAAMQEIYRSSIEYITDTLMNVLRDDQVVFFRASTSGHSNGNGICSSTQPLRETIRIKYFEFNWHGQEAFNALWKTFLDGLHLRGKAKNVRYLDIYRPTMLRPDAVRLFIFFLILA
jgi:GDSL/SGNH-like Acyl-Esterase family found in Pmr5 and Cas1p